MHIPPVLDYCGLTIITNPSRFDSSVNSLITGQAGDYFDVCLHPFSRMNCELMSPKFFNGELRPGTKAILALGEEAQEKLNLNKAGNLDTIRGYPHQFNDSSIYIIPSFHHQDAMDRRDFESVDDDEAKNDLAESDTDIKNKTKTKRKNYRWWLYQDVKKVCRIIKHGGILPKEEEWTTILAPEIGIIKEKFAVQGKTLILDIETAKNFTMTCFGLGILETREVMVIPWKRFNNELQYSEEESREIIRWLIIALARNKVVAHNAMFDFFILAWKYKVLPPKDAFDTMIAWHRLRPECEKSLGHLISYFTYLPYHKNEGIFEPKNSAQDYQLWNYNAKDIITTGIIYERLQLEIKKYKAEESVQLGCREIPAYLSLSLKGARMDVDKREKRIVELLQKQEALDKCLGVVSRKGTLNPRSSDQVSNYLYKNLALVCPNEEEPTKEITLRKVQLKHNIPSLNLILASRGARKNASSLSFTPYGGIGDIGPFNRMTCSWVLAGPDTYRLGSRTILKRKNVKKSGYGTNFQNWNKSNRDLIIADDGKILFQIDQSGAEALIVSYLCTPGKFRDLFIYGVKPHVFVALHIFKTRWKKRFHRPETIEELCKLPPSGLKKHPGFKEVDTLIKSSDDWIASERFYFIAKMVCHASNYAAGWPTLQNNILDKSEGQIVLNASEARAFITHYHCLFPEIRKWHLDIQSELKNSGRVLRNLFGHPRQFNEAWGDTLFKQAYAFKGQSTVGQITNYAMVNSFEAIQRHEPWTEGVDLLQNGHDSVMGQCLIGTEREVTGRIQNLIEMDLVNPKGDKFKMRAEVQVGKNWKPFNEKTNPEGLKGL